MRPQILVGVLGALLVLIGASMLVPFVLALIYGGGDATAFGISALVTMAVGGVSVLLARNARRKEVNHREGFGIVSLGWILAAAFGALPFWLYGHGVGVEGAEEGRCAAVVQQLKLKAEPELFDGYEFCEYTNAYFETMSGLTTTGATILTRGLWPSVDEQVGLPHGILFWRALTHWLGGMGIILLSLAVLPLLGVGGMQLYRAEVPGPTSDKLRPRISQTAKSLWIVYAVISAAEVVLLLLGDSDLYVAVTHTFGTMATGGFSVLAKSAEGFESPYIEWVTTIFMLAAGVNFSLHYLALRGDPKAYLRDPELRFFLGVFLLATVAIAVAIYGSTAAADAEEAVRLAAFQVASIVTTTGYSSTNFELWSVVAPLAPFLLVLLMFVGGCAGSTGGGMKCVRVALASKVGYRELFHLVHPRAMKGVRLGRRVVPPDILKSVVGFVLLYLAVFALGALALSVLGLDYVSASTVSAATIGNIGPGLGGIGPYDNYFWIPTSGKWVCIAEMLMGRLEVYTVLVLLLPRAWSRR